MSWTILKLLKWTEQYFSRYDIKSSRIDAEILLAHVLTKKRIDLYLDFERVLSQGDLDRFKVLVQRRILHEPIQYILGRQEFWSMDFEVGSGVLIPRPETECLIEKALEILKSISKKRLGDLFILDIGTGSGIIPIVLAKEIPQLRAYGVDISPEALVYARRNATRHGVDDRITWIQGDLFSNLSELKFDMILSNPPYLAETAKEQIERQVKDFEPTIALFSGKTGMQTQLNILGSVQNYLKPQGAVVLEISPEQASHLKNFLINKGTFPMIEIIEDLQGKERVLFAHG